MDILNKYKEYFFVNNLKIDDAQLCVLEKLANLHNNIDEYKNHRANKILSFVIKKQVPKGLYLYGSVGTGKSMLLELFFNNVNLLKKKQLHFHSFMIEVHNLIHSIKKQNNYIHKLDCLTKIASDISKDYRLLYIDELEILDIADAMLVGKLFRELFNNNIMIVISSNRKPDDLYLDGLKRELFLNFIDLIKENLDVWELGNKKDYRIEKSPHSIKTFFFPLGKEADKFIESSFLFFSKNNLYSQIEIDVKKRKLICKRACENVVLFDFVELFQQNLGSSDFIALTERFKVIIIANIPKMTEKDRNEARRFVDFIDVAYVAKTIFICSSEVFADKIYEHGNGSFEFERTISRLIEMQSQQYLNFL